jgi:hypothetical protein
MFQYSLSKCMYVGYVLQLLVTGALTNTLIIESDDFKCSKFCAWKFLVLFIGDLSAPRFGIGTSASVWILRPLEYVLIRLRTWFRWSTFCDNG